jgi:Concanavalin A-like lectin/glucanases superfamily/Putative Ig domain
MTTTIKVTSIDPTALTTIQGPRITTVYVTDSSYNNLDDTAVDSTSGGYIKIIGTGFASGCIVAVGNLAATSTTFVSSTEVRAQVQAQSAGSYTLYVSNSDGSLAIRVLGVAFSGFPAWSTSTSQTFGSTTVSFQFSATSDSTVTYSVNAGSSLPPGLSLSSSGLLSGTFSGTSGTVYTFTLQATDSENQNTPRTFSVTVAGAEPYFYLTSLLLHGDGTNGANNNTFVDSSTNAATITRNGTTAQGTFSPFSQTGWSMYTGTGGSGYGGGTGWIQTASSSAINIGTGAFTVEFWVHKLSNVPGNYANYFGLNNYTNGILFRDESAAGSDAFYIGGTAYNIQPQTYIPLNQWVHVAVTRNASGNFALFANGSRFYSGTNAYNLGSSAAIAFADVPTGSAGASNPPSCYMSNMRITNTAVYDPTLTSLTVPTAPLTAISGTLFLAGKDNRFVDTSSNAQTITISGTPAIVPFSPFAPATAYSTSTNGGSAYFNGSTDWLTAPNGSQFTFAGNFTAECWFYVIAAAGAYNGIFAKRTSGATYSPFLLGTSSGASGSASISLLMSLAGGWNINTNFSTLYFNQWYHIALVRSGTTVSVFLNGSRVYTTTLSGALYTTSDAFSVGAHAANGYGPFNGYISNARIVDGTAVYDPTLTTCTVPTAPVTAVTNTALLINATNAAIYDQTAKNNITTAGTAVISTAQSKFGGSSIYFATSGDGLTIPANNFTSVFGTGNFTIEFWMRYTTSGNQTCDLIRSTTWAIVDYSNGNLYWQNAYATSSLLYYSHGSLSDGNWHHVAIVRSATSTLTMYVDGTSIGSGTDANAYNTSSAVTIGISGSYGQFLGYMDDIRITKGYARYTANFTPPTSTFKDQ